MGKTYKKLGFWGGRSVSGYRRVARHHKEIRPKARIPDSWNDYHECPLRFLPYRISFALHKKGWDNEKIRQHLRWKFKLNDNELARMGFSWHWKCDCKQCTEYRRNRYGL